MLIKQLDALALLLLLIVFVVVTPAAQRVEGYYKFVPNAFVCKRQKEFYLTIQSRTIFTLKAKCVYPFIYIQIHRLYCLQYVSILRSQIYCFRIDLLLACPVSRKTIYTTDRTIIISLSGR